MPSITPPPASALPVSVLFVCTGNICRSPTAEAVFRARAAGAGLAARFRVDSCGTDGWHAGEAPDARSAAAASARGYDMADLRARRMTAADARDFDPILAMDRGHLRQMRARFPRAAGRMHLFLEPVADAVGRLDVPDPYYGGAGGFEAVLDMVERAAEAWLHRLAPAHP